MRHKWAGLDSELPAAGKSYPRNDNILFPLPSKNLAQGNLDQERDPLKKVGHHYSATVPGLAKEIEKTRRILDERAQRKAGNGQ